MATGNRPAPIPRVPRRAGMSPASCQQHRCYLITDNRNDDDDTSLEAVIRTRNNLERLKNEPRMTPITQIMGYEKSFFSGFLIVRTLIT